MGKTGEHQDSGKDGGEEARRRSRQKPKDRLVS